MLYNERTIQQLLDSDNAAQRNLAILAQRHLRDQTRAPLPPVSPQPRDDQTKMETLI